MKQKLTMLVRILFGLLFLVMGINYFYNFITLPPLPYEASNFMTALANTGYVLKLNAVLQIVAGLMLIFNFFVPLALVLLAPLIVHIALFHFYLDPSGLGLAITVVLVEIFLAAMYWDNYAHFFKRR